MKKQLLVLGLGLVLTLGFGLGLLTSRLSEEASASPWGYENGTYRGAFIDGNEIQVAIQFTLVENTITQISYRHLGYTGVDYLKSSDKTIAALTSQYQQLAEFLIGKDIRTALPDLYSPGTIVTEKAVDTFAGATLRAGKVISAIRDGLNRGVYSY